MKWRYTVWFLVGLIRLVLFIAGWVLTPLYIWIDTSRTEGMNLWERYVEHAWRNPTPYLRGLLKQPIKEERPNPDTLVRTKKQPKATRKMVHGIYWEHWSLELIDEDHRAAKINKKWIGRYWEFRIGWKFVDGNDAFYPTFQIGPKR